MSAIKSILRLSSRWVLGAMSGHAAAGGLSDQLPLSSAWCSFSYNRTSGTTRTTRAQFSRNGTYSFGNPRETVSSGQYGTHYGQGGGCRVAEGTL